MGQMRKKDFASFGMWQLLGRLTLTAAVAACVFAALAQEVRRFFTGPFCLTAAEIYVPVDWSTDGLVFPSSISVRGTVSISLAHSPTAAAGVLHSNWGKTALNILVKKIFFFQRKIEKKNSLQLLFISLWVHKFKEQHCQPSNKWNAKWGFLCACLCVFVEDIALRRSSSIVQLFSYQVCWK